MKSRYSVMAIGLHWLMAVLLVFMIWLGWNMGDLPRGETLSLFGAEMAAPALYNLHKSLGISILVLALLRLVLRVMDPPPALPAGMKPWEENLAKATHYGFYVLMIGIPLLGWALVSTSKFNGVPTLLFDAVPWPHIPGLVALTGTAKSVVHGVAEFLHSKLVWVLIVLIVLHIAAALKHQFLDRDNLMARMLPFLRR